MKIFKSIYNFCASWTGTIVIVLVVVLFVAQAFVIPSRSMVGTLYEGDMLFVKKFSYGIPTPKLPWIDLPLLPDFRGDGHLISGDRPKRGDIIVFNPPHDPKTHFVKRGFAVGGDEVIFTRKGMYLHLHEGDEFILSRFDSSKIVTMMDKKFVFEPYSQEHLGIHYKYDNSSYFRMIEIVKKFGLFGMTMDRYNPNTMMISMSPIELNGELAFYKKIALDEFFMVGDNRDNSEDSRFWGSVPYKNIVGKPWFIYFSISLKNSFELGADKNPKSLFNIRWSRMFKSVHQLETAMKNAQSSTQKGVEQGFNFSQRAEF